MSTNLNNSDSTFNTNCKKADALYDNDEFLSQGMCYGKVK